jgi:hypothetical protein
VQVVQNHNPDVIIVDEIGTKQVRNRTEHSGDISSMPRPTLDTLQYAAICCSLAPAVQLLGSHARPCTLKHAVTVTRCDILYIPVKYRQP